MDIYEYIRCFWCSIVLLNYMDIAEHLANYLYII